MKSISKIIQLALMCLVILSCSNDDDASAETFGQFEIKWDNIVGITDMTLAASNAETTYPFETASGEKFNISLFGYYITNIKLEGPNGEIYEDEVAISASGAKGVYHVQENDVPSQLTTLSNVPTGKYNKLTFTVGIPEEGVQESAAGGVLDPANGAWFWNWNSGYIGFAVEGNAENSAQQEQDFGNGSIVPAKAYALHVGGWRDIAPQPGENQVFVNNVRTITLDFDGPVNVAANLLPSAHVLIDAKELFDSAAINFSTTYSIHAPAAGKAFADQLSKVFKFGHTHQ